MEPVFPFGTGFNDNALAFGAEVNNAEVVVTQCRECLKIVFAYTAEQRFGLCGKRLIVHLRWRDYRCCRLKHCVGHEQIRP